ncbi:MAG: DUF2970 domain-containing protein [Gammaproteobacteria bacterium]|nr:DUF2970 domain-containing protein [Gammaproteobacteria bacterium]
MTKNKSLWQAMKSAGAALFGVQNSKQHQEDFENETPFPFILAGVILVISFLLIVAAIVRAVLP